MNAGRMVKHGLATLFPGKLLVKGRKADGAIAVTFDDGPHPENTPRILDVLEAAGATATFFVEGKAAEKNPALIREISVRGHQIGNHGYSHLDAKQSPLAAYVEEAERTQEILQNILGCRLDKIFRPPFGNTTAATFIALTWRGFRFVFWSVDSRDSFVRQPAELTAHISSLKITGGDILLFHEDYTHTVVAFPQILRSLRARSLQFYPVSRL